MEKQKGFTLVESLVAVALVGLLLMFLMTVTQQYYTIKKANDLSRTAANLRDLMVDSINSVRGWSQTVHNPSNNKLRCLKDATDCYNQSGPFAVINGTGNIIFDPVSSPNNGFDAIGRLCTGFNSAAASGSDACPLRFNISWQAVCTTSPCLNPQILIKGDLDYNPLNRNLPFNPAKYSFSFVRNLEGNSLLAACAALKGIFSDVTKTCTLPMVGNCPLGQFVVGLDKSKGSLNQKICRPYLQGSCPAGQLMTQINGDGTFICSNTCTTTAPPPTPVGAPPAVPPNFTASGVTTSGIGGAAASSDGGASGDGGCGGADGCM